MGTAVLRIKETGEAHQFEYSAKRGGEVCVPHIGPSGVFDIELPDGLAGDQVTVYSWLNDDGSWGVSVSPAKAEGSESPTQPSPLEVAAPPSLSCDCPRRPNREGGEEI